MTEYFAHDGIETAYDVQGSGPTLLLIHGLQGGRRMLAGFAALLAEHFRVVCYDQRDSGETRNPPQPYDLERLADDAASLITGLGLQRPHIFGTSFGGRLAQVLAVKHPDQLDHLVLGATWRMPQSMADANPEGLARFMRIRSELPASANELAEMFAPTSFLAQHPEVRSLLTSMSDAPERAQRRAQAGNTTFGDAKDIRAPTLVVAGELDEMVPMKASLAIAEAIDGARSITLEGVGHVASMQAPKQLAEAIRQFIR